MCERLVLYQTVLSDTPEIRSVRLVLAEKTNFVPNGTFRYSRDEEFKAAP
jgi:hypothetical protein